MIVTMPTKDEGHALMCSITDQFSLVLLQSIICLCEKVNDKMCTQKFSHTVVNNWTYLKRYSHLIWDKKFMFDIMVDY